MRTTDIKADNIMFSIDDGEVFEDFEQEEIKNPSPRKEADGRIIYESRRLRMPKKMGSPVLCDLGSAVIGGIEHTEDVQPDIYRAPEVILEVPWSYEIDIWNAACVVSAGSTTRNPNGDLLMHVDMGPLSRCTSILWARP